MICKNCGKNNEDDSKYCRECGTRLFSGKQLTPDDHLKIGELIYSAYKHSEAGRLDDAILACQGALAIDDDNASAHSLLGSLYEKRGDISLAIAEYERVVALNPNSIADQQKLLDLRSGKVSKVVQAKKREEYFEKLRPYFPSIAAATVTLFILIIGLCMLRGSSGSSKETKRHYAQSRPPQQSTAYPGQPSQPFMGSPQPGTQVQGQQMNPMQGIQQATGQQTASQSTAERKPETERQQAEAPRIAKQGIPSVPLPGTENKQQTQVKSGESVRQPSNKTTATTSKEQPVIVPLTDGVEAQAQPSPPAAPPKPAPTIIVHEPAPEPPIDVEDKAVQLQRAGKYREAISAYRESLNQTTDPGRVYQQIALCYQRLGEYSQAIDNYNRAIRSFREQQAAGRDAAEVQKNIRSCGAGIEVCRNHAR
ncbi:MAG: tetratricopeptide repeat protein [Armatimonadetes bacterium]|nr:tetratricopeptide repeat protein [Armatimonadota bacterium]